MSMFIRAIQRLRLPLLLKLQLGFVLIALTVSVGILVTWLTFDQLGHALSNQRVALVSVSQGRMLAQDVSDVGKDLADMKYVVQNTLGANSEYGGSTGGMDNGMYSLHHSRLQNDLNTTTVSTEALRRVLLGLDNPPKDVTQMLPTLAQPTGTQPQMPGANFATLVESDLPRLAAQIDAFEDPVRRAALGDPDMQLGDIDAQLDRAAGELDVFNKNFADLNQQLYNFGDAEEQTATASRERAQVILFAFGISIILFALGFGTLVSLAITRPIDRVRRRLGELSDGDLRGRLEPTNGDQLGVLAHTFNQSMNNLGNAIDQVQGQSLRVNSASSEIAAAARQQASLANEQAGAVAEATVTIEELSHTAQQIAEAATLVANAAEQAMTNAGEGQETVKESISGINIIKLRVQDIAAKILALSERAQRVNKIIELISSIAQETHLLALNAAIESAGAGEQGRRFSEVAKKVKQLSERTRAALREVQVALAEIQEATNASVMATEQGLKEAERGVTLAHRSGDANESIIQMVERTVQLASAISLATQQQRSASEQVVASMRQLAVIIREGAASAQQSSDLAAALDQVALDLRDVAGRFRLPEPVAPVLPETTAAPLGVGAGSADSGGPFAPDTYPMLGDTPSVL